ncbi:MAG: hypothetical protein ACREXU_05090 [Gammaproteobacteria bacterium]
MGWLYYAATKKALIADRTTAWETDGVRGTTLAFCVRGNRLWKVVEVEYGTKERYIALDLLAYRGQWGYKDLYEAEHPFHYDCPLGYLAQVAVECEKWREGVQAYHARIHRRVEIGQRIALSGARIPWVRIVSVRPLRGEYRGTVYRLPRALLGEVLPESVP